MQIYISPDEEIRDKTLISKKTKAIWNIETDLVIKFLDVCKKYNLKTFAFAGTLLGAVRHKGFIPWDDDVDFAMLRPDYDKLLTVAEKEFSSPYFFQTCMNDREFFFGYARLRNSETTGLITTNVSSNYNNGIYIDIFVLDGLTTNERALNRQLLRRNVVFSFAYHYNCSLLRDKNIFQKTYHFLVRFIARIKPYEYWVEKYNEILQTYNDDATRFATMTDTKKEIKKYCVETEDLEEIVDMQFETIMIPAPKRYHRMLQNMYGDYMVPPPKEQRGKWHDGILIFDPYTPYKEYIERNYRF